MELVSPSPLLAARLGGRARPQSQARRAESARTLACRAQRDSHAARDLTTLGLEDLWDHHGASAYALACALMGDEAAAVRVVTLAMREVAHSTGGESTEDAARALARRVYRHSRDLTAGPSGSSDLPPVMVWLSRLARLQRACLGLCFYGGLTQRETAELLGVPPATVAEMLRSGLRELGRLAAQETLADA